MLLPFLSQRPIAPWAALSVYGRLVANAVPTGAANAKPATAPINTNRRTTRARLFVTETPPGEFATELRVDSVEADPLRRLPPPDPAPCRPVDRRFILLNCRHVNRTSATTARSDHGTAQKCFLPVLTTRPGSTLPAAADGVIVTRADIRNSGRTP